MTEGQQAGRVPKPGATPDAPLFAWLFDLMRPEGMAVADGPLLRALQAVRGHYLNATAFSAVVSILYLSSSIYMMLVYDKVLSSGSHAALAMITIALVLALATLAYLDCLRGGLLQRAGLKLDRILSPVIMHSVLGNPSGGDPRRNQLLRDFDQVRGTITGQPVQAIMDAPWTPVFLIVLFIIHWSLALLAITAAVLFLAIAHFTERRVREPNRKANEAAAAVNVALEGSLRNFGPIRAMGMGVPLVSRWESQRESFRSLGAVAGETSLTSSSVLKFLRLLWQSLALGLGAWLAIDGAIAPGAMIAASILMGRTLAPLEQALGAWRPLVSSADAYARLKAALSTPQRAPEELVALPAFTGKLEVRELTIAGVGGALILDKVSFSLQPGEMIGIVGASGAGKSTLVKALLGLVPPTSGSIRFDGAEHSQWRPADLAARIGYLPQDIGMMPASVRDNISRFEAYTANPPADIDAAVVAACQAAGIHETILRLPQGYDTIVEGGPVNMSGGQKQKLGLARALYRQPALVVLDEPNANLDHAGEATLLATLRALREAKISAVVVTHRSNLLMSTHKVLTLGNGRVEAYGPRDEVLARLMPAVSRPTLTPVPVGGSGS